MTAAETEMLQAKTRRARRVLARAAAGAVVITVAVVAAFGGAAKHRAQQEVHSRPRATTTSTRGASTGTTSSTTSATVASTPPATAPASLHPVRLVGEPAPATLLSEPTPSTSSAAPTWPAGTLLGFRNLTATLAFTTPAVSQGGALSWRATVTNPHNVWVFAAMQSSNWLAAYFWSDGTDGMLIIKSVGVPATASELQHETSQGPETGLLLAPHASYTYSGSYNGVVEPWKTTDYVVQAAAIIDPGWGQSFGEFGASAPGSISVTVPPTTATSTTSTTPTTSTGS